MSSLGKTAVGLSVILFGLLACQKKEEDLHVKSPTPEKVQSEKRPLATPITWGKVTLYKRPTSAEAIKTAENEEAVVESEPMFDFISEHKLKNVTVELHTILDKNLDLITALDEIPQGGKSDASKEILNNLKKSAKVSGQKIQGKEKEPVITKTNDVKSMGRFTATRILIKIIGSNNQNEFYLNIIRDRHGEGDLIRRLEVENPENTDSFAFEKFAILVPQEIAFIKSRRISYGMKILEVEKVTGQKIQASITDGEPVSGNFSLDSSNLEQNQKNLERDIGALLTGEFNTQIRSINKVNKVQKQQYETEPQGI